MPQPLFYACPPFLKELYDAELSSLVPDLVVHVGDPGPDERVSLLEGRAFILDDHSHFDRALLERCKDLRCIVFLGTGSASFIDEAAAAELGIRVRNYKGYGDRSVAEHAFAMMLAAARRLAA